MQEEEVGIIMRERESLCVCAAFFVFPLFFFRVSDPVFQGVQLEEKWGRQCQRVAAPHPPAISVFADFFFRLHIFLASF